MQQIGGPGSVSIAVALDIDAEPIHGSVDDGSGAPIEFTGWLELMSVITKLQTRAADDREATWHSARTPTKPKGERNDEHPRLVLEAPRDGA
jgi:hypothetical protein